MRSFGDGSLRRSWIPWVIVACAAVARGEGLRDLEVPGHVNDPGDVRINLVFFLVNAEDFAAGLQAARERSERLLDFEPFASNPLLVNFWYLDENILVAPDDDAWCYRSSCAEEAQKRLVELDRLTGPSFALTYCLGFSCFATNSMTNGYYMPAFNSPNGEVHELGHFFAQLIDEYGGEAELPRLGENCVATYIEAAASWGRYVGDGCGEDGVVDCLEARGGTGEHYNEVAFFTGNPDKCFDELGRPRAHCYFSLTINLAYRAVERDECLASEEDCVFFEQGTYYCKRPGEDAEECPVDSGVGCGYSSDGFRSSLCSIMCYHFPGEPAESVPWLSYGLVNQRAICEDFIEARLGASGGVCARFSDGELEDCNANTVPDDVDIALALSGDCDLNGVPDECDPDCNENGVPDACDVANGTSNDCNLDDVPDECQLSGNDCNANDVPDECDIAAGLSLDLNVNGVPDECEVIAAVTVPAPPDSLISADGSRAIAFSGSFAMSTVYAAEDIAWNQAAFTNVGPGDPHAVVRECELRLDANGNGELDDADTLIASATFEAGSDELAFEDIGWTLPPDGEIGWFVVFALDGDAPAVAAAEPQAGARGAVLLGALVATIVVVLRRTRAYRRLVGAVSACVLAAFLVALAASAGGCGGGGGGIAPAEVQKLQLQLTRLDLSGVDSGEPVIVTGLPLTAWPLEL